MCGIAGTYLLPHGAERTARLTGALVHRGPDEEGYYSHRVCGGHAGNEYVHLGHRRLRIRDLSETGAQPMVCDGLALSYNGELYNAEELRSTLTAAGVRFRGSSDTEVVLRAWRLWGPGCLERLRGMFALAVFDEHTGELVLARDQLGIKPLFFAREGQGLAFASELKALGRTAEASPRVDEHALVASLLYYWVPDSHCALRGVRKLPAGTWLRICPDGTTESGRYFSLRALAEEAEGTVRDPAEAVRMLREVIRDSTARHLVSDVGVGSFLSGGLDSSYLTALAARERPGLPAYTVGFRGADARFEAMPDDLRYAREISARFGAELHEIEIAPDVGEILGHLAHNLDEPIGDPAAINTYLICQAARQAGVRVMLSGMGADELFAGYRKHLANVLAGHYQKVPAGLRRGTRSLVERLPVASARRGYRSVRFAKRFLSFAEEPEETAFRLSYTMYDRAELLGLLHPDLADVAEDVLTEHADTYRDNVLGDFVNRMCLADTRMFLPGLNLAYTDRASMAASTEVRVPFVDVEVVRAAFAVRGSEKIVGLRGKDVLKRAASDILPREVVHRPKGLFSAPLRAWMSRDLAGVVRDVVEDGALASSGFLNRDALRRLVEEDAGGAQDRSKQLWHIVTLEHWYQATTRQATRNEPVGSSNHTGDMA